MSEPCMSYVHVPPLTDSGHFLGFVIRIFSPWRILGNHSIIFEPSGRHTCCPVYEAPVCKLCCSELFPPVVCLGLSSPVISSVVLDQLFWCSCPTQPWPPFSQPLLGFSFRFLLFSVLVPCWLLSLSSKTFLRMNG